MSLERTLTDAVFAGRNEDPRKNCILQTDDATSPDGAVTAPKGWFLYIEYVGDDSNGDVFINDDGATSWVQIRNPVL